MPAPADIAFDCPHCKGPLMAEAAHVGMSCDCPHCFAQLEVPIGDAVNKDRFVEPMGLRRLLMEVRDREWEVLRRKLKAAHARTAELEAELHRANSVLAERAATPKPVDDKAGELDALQRQLGEMSEKFNQANLAFMASRKQQDSVIEHLSRELENARGECQAFKKKNEDLARQLQNTMQILEAARLAASVAEEVPRLQQELTEANDLLAEAQRKLEAEQAKVILMEAAAMTVDVGANGDTDKNAELVKELQIQLADLRKENKSLRGARDRATAEVSKLKKKMESEQEQEVELESAFTELEAGLHAMRSALHARRQLEPAAGK